MQSSLLVEYMRTGAISPLKRTDTKRGVEAKLGAPLDWTGREGGIGWTGPLLTDFHDSWAWHYGSLCVGFHLSGWKYWTPGIRLDYSINEPIIFPPPFEELPQQCFTLGELIELLRVHDIAFEDNRTDRAQKPGIFEKPVIGSEGGVAVATLHCNDSSNAEVIRLYPYKYPCS